MAEVNDGETVHRVARLGRLGDGIVETPTGSFAVADALPGEQVVAIAADEATSFRRVGPASPDRIEAACRHFTRCGGCAVQHVAPHIYGAWKRGLVLEAFAREGLAPEVGPLVTVPPESRRRVVLTARRERSGVRLGYHVRGSHDLVAITECPVAVPAITERLEGLAKLAEATLDRAAREATLRTTVTACTHGLDVLLEGAVAALDVDRRRQLAALAERFGLVRIVVAGDEVVRRAPPTLAFGGVAVELPPGAFVQAVEAAEAAMVAGVRAAVGKAAHIADLYAGLGTFALPLARGAEVTAFDSAGDSLAALATAVRGASGLGPLVTRRRDLAREPLSPRELAAFDAVVLDPPRAGAETQCARLARAEVPVAVLVSCNPTTLARDCRLLLEGGWRLDTVQAIDQFLFAPHVEAVAVLRRPKQRRRPGSLARRTPAPRTGNSTASGPAGSGRARRQ
jgi:23S rRNA (uracil1939-C5)-methyltransferase